MTVEAHSIEALYPVPQRLLDGEGGIPKPFVSSFEQYQELWEESVNHPDKFFGEVSFFSRFLLPLQYIDPLYKACS